MKKKLFALFFAICLVFSCSCLVFAADSENEFTYGDNLYSSDFVDNSDDFYINSSNQVISFSGWSVTDYIAVSPCRDYVYSASMLGYSPSTCFYDSDYNFISAFQGSNRASVSSPVGAAYVRISVHCSDFSTAQFREKIYLADTNAEIFVQSIPDFFLVINTILNYIIRNSVLLFFMACIVLPVWFNLYISLRGITRK